MLLKGALTSISLAIAAVTTAAVPVSKQFETRAAEQDAVTWDKYSLMINGDRTFLFSGEFHVSYFNYPSIKRILMLLLVFPSSFSGSVV